VERSRKIALIAHCLLNVNAKVEGLAEYRGVHPVVGALSERDFGIVQLPCPEMTALGMKRWGQTIEQYDTPFYQEHCAQLADEVARQVREYVRCGYQVGPLVGVQGSPSCGVTTTRSGDWGGHYDEERMAAMRANSERIDGSGVFVRELVKRLEPMGVVFVAVDEREGDGGVGRILSEL